MNNVHILKRLLIFFLFFFSKLRPWAVFLKAIIFCSERVPGQNILFKQ